MIENLLAMAVMHVWNNVSIHELWSKELTTPLFGGSRE
jgi:hypothetical protein